jgi:D-3-phosphoglycerate dehydrogenase
MKILIIDILHDSIHQLLKDTGLNYDYKPEIAPDQVVELLPYYGGLILRSKMKVTESMIRKAKDLRFIARAGAGVDEIDEKVLQECNVTLINAPEGNRDAVGEQTVGMLLSLLNNLNKGDREVRKMIWDREGNRGYELGNMTVGIIGYGNMGKAFAKRLSGFGCRVLAFDKYKENCGNQHAEQVDLDQLKSEMDILSLHTPLTPETKGMINEDFLSECKKKIIVLNTSRGPVFSFKDIVAGFEKGYLRGAGLDVLENEKLKTLTEDQKKDFDYLAQRDDVLFMPHVAGWTYESYEKLNKVIVDKIVNLTRN